MEDGQIDMWNLLGKTAEQLAGGLRSPKNPDAEAPGKSQGGNDPKGLSIAGATNSGTPYARAGVAKSKGMAIKPAKYGNRVVLVPRFRS